MEFGYLSDDIGTDLVDAHDHICRQLTIMMSETHKRQPRTE